MYKFAFVKNKMERRFLVHGVEECGRGAEVFGPWGGGVREGCGGFWSMGQRSAGGVGWFGGHGVEVIKYCIIYS